MQVWLSTSLSKFLVYFVDISIILACRTSMQSRTILKSNVGSFVFNIYISIEICVFFNSFIVVFVAGYKAALPYRRRINSSFIANVLYLESHDAQAIEIPSKLS